jgi:hypothetical protein
MEGSHKCNVMCFHGNASATIAGLLEEVIARQQGKWVCMGQQQHNSRMSSAFCFIYPGVICAMFGGSPSPQHGASSGRGQREGLQ